MSRKLFSLSLSVLLCCGAARADVPRVAVDIAPVHSLVARVMAGIGTPDLIIPAGETPHGFSMRPSAAAALQRADLVFWVGPELTPQLEDAIVTLAEGAAVTGLLETDGSTLLEFREGALFEAHAHDHGGHNKDEDHAAHDDHDHDKHEDHAAHEDHDHDKDEDHAGHDEHGHDEHAGHDHGAFDPHAWLSPANAAVWLNVIAAQLSAADPENAGGFFANAAAGREELAALSDEVAALLAPHRSGRFIVFHDAYQYFERDFGLSAAGAISISDASDPSPARIAEVQALIAREGIDCVLAEPQFNSGLVTAVLDGTGANTGIIDPIGAELAPGAALYPQMIRNMGTALATCFSD